MWSIFFGNKIRFDYAAVVTINALLCLVPSMIQLVGYIATTEFPLDGNKVVAAIVLAILLDVAIGAFYMATELTGLSK